jgi:hypothetical protein
MAEKKENKTNKPRTQLKDLPKNEKELTPEERRKVRGGEWIMTPAGQVKPSGN